MKRLRVFHIGVFCISILCGVFALSTIVIAQTETPTQTPSPTPSGSVTPTPGESTEDIENVNNTIRSLETKIAELKDQEKSFSTQIGVMDNQIQLTEYRIKSTESELDDLSNDIELITNKVTNLESSLETVVDTLLKRVVASYESKPVEPFHVLLSSENFFDFVKRVNYVEYIQENDKKLLVATQQAKADYENQQQIFEQKKQKAEALSEQLASYKTDLDSQKKQKQTLLTETQGSEANYQRLLAQAKAQLAGFSRFTQSQGGASILSGQTVCDDWGCYYNQRDSQWGGSPLNGTQFTLASDGCLVTAMAMVYTHYGYSGVTPATINGNSGNFASYYPAYLNFTISANGVTFSRSRISRSEMDSELSSGRPVVVGISYDGGPVSDHFIVVISGSNGSYMMNDPFTPNGHNIPFTSKYSIGSINDIYKINT